MNKSQYQVNCVWGISGALRIGTIPDVVIWIDVIDSVAEKDINLTNFSVNSRILQAGLRDAFAVADWVADFQLLEQRRVEVLLVCAGEKEHNIEDQLAAGAIIERLAQRGLDALSPEAAVANAAYSGLSAVMTHLIKASESGRVQTIADNELRLDHTLTPHDVRVIR